MARQLTNRAARMCAPLALKLVGLFDFYSILKFKVVFFYLEFRLVESRKDDSFLQLQYFWTCSCVLVTFLMLLTETSEPLKS